MALHSLWNASIILLAFGGLRLSAVGLPQSGLMGWLMIIVGVSILAALCLGTPIALATLNRRLRLVSVDEPSPGAVPQESGEAGARSAPDVGK
jgi:hypothetical protein